MADPTRITVSVPAAGSFETTLGIVADSAAASSEFDADRVDDIDLAVEETAGALIELPGSEQITMHLEISPRRLECQLTAQGVHQDASIVLDDIRSLVVDATCDSVAIDDVAQRVTLVFTNV